MKQPESWNQNQEIRSQNAIIYKDFSEAFRDWSKTKETLGMGGNREQEGGEFQLAFLLLMFVFDAT